MKTLAYSLLITLSLGFVSPVQAQAPEDEMEPVFPQKETAQDLLWLCAASRLTPKGRERRRYCAGFVSGVEETARLLKHTGRSEYRVCTPGNVSASTLAEVFVQYGATHKGELANPAAETVLHALQKAYPCPR